MSSDIPSVVPDYSNSGSGGTVGAITTIFGGGHNAIPNNYGVISFTSSNSSVTIDCLTTPNTVDLRSTAGVQTVSGDTATGISNIGTSTNVIISNPRQVILGQFGMGATSPTHSPPFGNTILPGGFTMYTINRVSPALYTLISTGTGFISFTLQMGAYTAFIGTGYFTWGITNDQTGTSSPTTTTYSNTLNGVAGACPLGSITVPCSEISNFNPSAFLYIYISNPTISPSLQIAGQAGETTVMWTSYNPTL